MNLAPLAYVLKKKDGSEILLHREDVLSLAGPGNLKSSEYLLDLIDTCRRLLSHQSVVLAKDPSTFVSHSWLLTEALRVEERCLEILSTYLQKEGLLAS